MYVIKIKNSINVKGEMIFFKNFDNPTYERVHIR